MKSLKLWKTASSEMQYKINTSIIYNYLLENEPISRATISKNLGISAPVVSNIIKKLIEKNFVIETVKGEPNNKKSGKKPILLEINDKKSNVLGIDLGKSKFKIALSDSKGNIISKRTTFKIKDDKDITKKILNEIKDITRSHKNLDMVCVAIPAAVNPEEGRIIGGVIYKEWEKINFKKILEESLKIPVMIENDVNLSALAEKYYGKGKNITDMIFLEISSGIGTGIIIDNNLFKGFKGLSGEIGFSVLDVNKLKIKYKEKGFLEEYASVDALQYQAQKKITDGKNSIILDMVKGDIKKIDSSIVCKAALQGDSLANNIVSYMADLLSITIINMVLFMDTQLVVLGGDICILPGIEDLFLKPIKNNVENIVPYEIPKIEVSGLGSDAGVVGASLYAIQSLVMNEFPFKIGKF